MVSAQVSAHLREGYDWKLSAKPKTKKWRNVTVQYGQLVCLFVFLNVAIVELHLQVTRAQKKEVEGGYTF